MSDISTIAALKLGNQFAFETVFHAFHPKVYGYILQKTHSAYMAEEVVQLSWPVADTTGTAERLPVTY